MSEVYIIQNREGKFFKHVNATTITPKGQYVEHIGNARFFTESIYASGKALTRAKDRVKYLREKLKEDVTIMQVTVTDIGE